MLWLYRWIRGALTVEITAAQPEDLLNLCAKNGVMVWHVKRVGGKIRCRIGIRDFKRLPKLAKYKGIRVHILQKSGLPFLAARYGKRYGIAVGAALFFAVLQFLSVFIWSIEVVGNNQIPTEDLLRACREIGIREGTYAYGQDYKTASQQLLLRVPGLSWCSMNLEGCRLTLNVSEIKTKKTEDHAPSNLKAKADGTITKLDIKSGNCLVKVGDTVAKGDLLVSGVLEPSGAFVHAQGTVTAKTVRFLSVSVPAYKKETRTIGKSVKKRALSVFGITVPLYLGRTAGEYRAKSRIIQARLFGVNLPLRLYEKTFTFLKTGQRKWREEEQRQEAERILAEKIEQENLRKAEVQEREYTNNQGKLTLQAVVTAEEEITCEEKLLFHAGN